MSTQNHSRFAVRPLLMRVGVLLAATVLFALAFNTFSPGAIPWGDPPVPQSMLDLKSEGFVEIDLAAAQGAVADGKSFVILDARSLEDFDRGHLPGAISAPGRNLQETLPLVRQMAGLDDKLLIYCSGSHCADSINLARALKTDGYKQLHVFSGGVEAWQAAGLSLE